MKAAVDSSSAGSKRSITECMADALAESLGVELSDGLGAQERFKIAGVRYRGGHFARIVVGLRFEYKYGESFGFGQILPKTLPASVLPVLYLGR